jgi:hypothetical protein
MWLFKKKDEKKAVTPERRWELLQEWERIKDDDEKLMKFGHEHFEELPETEQYAILIYTYRVFREKIGQEDAEQWVADRLHCFSESTRREITNEIWGGMIEDYLRNKKWKTGRSECPYNVDPWMDPKVNPKAKKPKM